MVDDDDFFDLQRELFMERKQKYGHREEGSDSQTVPVKHVPVDTGEACVGG